MLRLKNILIVLFATAITAGYVNAAILVWSDEFNGAGVDASKWVYDVGGDGWGNKQLEYDTDGLNASVSDGNLIIEARRENYKGKPFTSTRMKTKGKFSFQYGTVEIRAKIPNLDNGLWPALWMMGNSGYWPACGELDIVEMGSWGSIRAGTQNRRYASAAHWESGGRHAGSGAPYTAPSNLTGDFHIWKMDWTPAKITVSMDGTQHWSFDISSGTAGDLEAFHQPFYLLMNFAVGGGYTGITGVSEITAPLPAKMYIDYVRVYQDTVPQTILSQGKPATASTTQSNNPAANANDGGVVTRWVASNSLYPQWWKVDLGANYNLSKVDVDWYDNSNRAYKYKIEVSMDGTAYTTKVDKTGNTTYGDTSDSFTAAARYVRVTVTGCTIGSAYASAYEVKVYGK
jgi:beta-glucanase (GH16 family)